MKRASEIGLLVSFSLFAFLGSTPVSLAQEGGAPALDPERDLSVSSRGQREGADAGFVLGTVTNKSSNAYPCVLLEFELFTRFDLRKPGETSTHLGNLVVEVTGVEQHAGRDFKKRLPYPAGFRLESTSVCKGPPPAPTEEPPGKELPDAPEIITFGSNPNRIREGQSATLHWQTANTEQAFLGEANLRVSQSSPELVFAPHKVAASGSSKVTPTKTTTYRLEAKKQGRSVFGDVKLEVEATAVPPATEGKCTISGQLTGKWKQEIRERPEGPASTWIVDVIILSDGSRRPLARATVSSIGQYKAENLPAGSKYVVRPVWESDPREDEVSCVQGRNHRAATFRITGRPLID